MNLRIAGFSVTQALNGPEGLKIAKKKKPDVISSVSDIFWKVETGELSKDQLELLLNNLPLDITFVDENDEVRFFSNPPHRIFTRSKAIIGRKIQNCHPPDSVHMVDQIIESFKAGVDGGADVVYFGGENFTDSTLTPEDYQSAIEYGKQKGVEVYLSTPRIDKKLDELGELKTLNELSTNQNPDGFLVANPGALHRLHNSTDKTLIIDYPLNVFNRLAMTHYLEYCQRVTLSPELTLDEIKQMAPHGPVECIVHGFFPLMVSEHDLLGELFPDDKVHDAILEDEKGFTYPVKTDEQKRTYVMNSRELCMLNHIPDLIDAGVSCLRIEAKTYDKKTTGKLTQSYRKAIDNGTMGHCGGKYSTGHYFSGVL